MNPSLRPPLFGLALLSGFGLAAVAPAQTVEQREALGIDPAVGADRIDAPGRASAANGITSLLLVPESTNDRVMAFDPETGDLVDADYVPADPDNLSTPINAIPGPNCTILVSDQLDDVVQQYDKAGRYLGVFAPAGGRDTAILDNIRGIEFHPERGTYLVTVASGTNAGAIAEFDASGTYLGNFIAPGSGGIASPFDIAYISDDFLVAEINNDALLQYMNDGTFRSSFAAVDTFPEQVIRFGSTIYAVNFSGSAGDILVYATDGTLIRSLDVPGLGGFRGVYELGNGNLLATNGGGVHEIDPLTGALIETKIASVSARFIERFDGMGVPYGTGCAGSAGFTPRVAVAGCLEVSERVTFEASGGYGGAHACYLFGGAEAQIPILGCDLLVQRFLAVAGVTLGGTAGMPGEGAYSLPVRLPVALADEDLYVQLVAIDPGAPQGVSFSNGVHMHVDVATSR